MASGKFTRAVGPELRKEINRVQREVRKVVFNAVGYTQSINEERVDTGFMINNWYFGLRVPGGDAQMNPGDQSFTTPKTARTQANLSRWRLGDTGYVLNNTEYASFHDAGTDKIAPLFFSVKVSDYIESHVRRIK